MSGGKRLPRAVREQQMLDAAVGVFARKGFHGSSMDDIAEAAQISKPMLYLYLGSKEDLFAACVAREASHFVEAVTREARPELAPREQVANGITAVFAFAAAHRDIWLMLYRQALVLPPFQDQAAAIRRHAVGAVSALLQRSAWGRHPADHFDGLAAALVGAGEALIDRMLEEADPDPRRAAALLIDFAWYGLGGRR